MRRLFGKKKEQFNPDMDNIPETEQKSLQEAVVNAIGVGSKDVKTIIVHFENDEKLDLIMSSETIKYVTNNQEQKVLSNIQWTAPDLFTEEDRSKIEEIFKTNKYFEAILEVSEQVSEKAANHIGNAFANNSMTLIERYSNQRVIKTEIDLTSPHSRKNVNNNGFFSLECSKIDSTIAERDEKKKTALMFAGESEFEDIKLSTSDTTDYFTATSDEERFIIVAATKNSTLKELVESAHGFDIIKVYVTVETLMWKSIIKIDTPEVETEDDDMFAIDSEDLESLINGGKFEDKNEDDTAVTDNLMEDLLKQEDSEIITTDRKLPTTVDVLENVSDDNDDSDEWRFSAPTDLADDDGAFEYEVVEDDIEGYTEGLDEELLIAVTRILDDVVIKDALRKDILNLVDYNTDLESSVRDIEVEIRNSRMNYRESFGEYQDIAIQIAVDDMNNIESEKDEDIEEVREGSNEQWFALEKLESDRFALNDTRTQILTDLKNKVSKLAGFHVQEVIHRIDIKLKGILSVSNVAFYDQSDKETDLLTVDPALLEENTTDKYDKRDTPVFFTIAATLGFNPFG